MKKIGNLHLDSNTRLYLEEKISNLRKYLLGFMSSSDEPGQLTLASLESEVQLMKATKPTKRSSLYDVLRKNPRESRWRDYSSILKSKDFSNRFPYYSGVIKGHFAKGLVRRYVSRSAQDCLPLLVNVSLPSLCCERICEYLSNECLLDVCVAAVGDESKIKRVSENE